MYWYLENKRIHRGTWEIPGSEQTSQIDYVLVSRRHGSSKLDVRTDVNGKQTN
jgi:hypothetical protein